jgi:hypothetical protein
MCCTAIEAHLSAQVVTLEQGHIGDEKARHSFAFALGRVRVVPQSRKVLGERHDSGALLVVETCTIGLPLLLITPLGLSKRTQRLVPLSLQRARRSGGDPLPVA